MEEGGMSFFLLVGWMLEMWPFEAHVDTFW